MLGEILVGIILVAAEHRLRNSLWVIPSGYIYGEHGKLIKREDYESAIRAVMILFCERACLC